MKKSVEIVIYQSGEIDGTWSPLCFLDNFPADKDLKQKTNRLISHDFWEPVEVDMYRVIKVDMCHWMTEANYLACYIALRFSVALAGDCVYDLEKEEFYKFADLSSEMRFVYGWLYKKTRGEVKSPFNQSLLDSFDRFLKGESKYSTPISNRQYEAVCRYCPVYEAKKISDQIYRRRLS